MDLKLLIETFASAVADSDAAAAMKASAYLGARLALEAVAASESSYLKDTEAKRLLASINDGDLVPVAALSNMPVPTLPDQAPVSDEDISL